MLDLETMGNTPTSAIVSIAAVPFDPVKGSVDVGNVFYGVVDLQSCIDVGLTVNASTIFWWMQQPTMVQRKLQSDPEPLHTQLEALKDYMSQFYDVKVWGKGPSFDQAILRNAYAKFGYALPWAFWNERCVRTIFALAKYNPRKKATHDPVDDAIAQAQQVIECYKRLGYASK